MKDSSLTISDHARRRMAQRNLPEQDVQFAFQHGFRLRRDGTLFVVLRRKDLPAAAQREKARLVGCTLVLDDTASRTQTAARATPPPVLVTVYRDRDNALRNLRRKGKERAPREHKA